jgi:hypothetical protein
MNGPAGNSATGGCWVICSSIILLNREVPIMKQNYRTALRLALAVLAVLATSTTGTHAQDQSKPGAPAAVQLMLLSEESPPNIVFVTSIAYDGNLGGLAGADQKCQALAEAAGLPANTYRAWLSTASVNAIARLGAARGWVRVDGKPFADTKADILAGRLFHPIRVDESGNDDNTPSGSGVWTGTGGDGAVDRSGDICNGWTASGVDARGVYGNNTGVTSLYTTAASASCNNARRLYCFGVNNQSVVTVQPAAGRIAFFTRGAWIPSGGLAGADQLCAAEAQQAGLNGSFKALLAGQGASAASRFDSNGQPWVRRDGVAIAPTAAALFSEDFIETAINQSADGLQYFGNYGAWVGAWSPTTPGTPETTCNNWSSSSAADIGISGAAGFTYQRLFFGKTNGNCYANWNHLYCLQE